MSIHINSDDISWELTTYLQTQVTSVSIWSRIFLVPRLRRYQKTFSNIVFSFEITRDAMHNVCKLYVCVLPWIIDVACSFMQLAVTVSIV